MQLIERDYLQTLLHVMGTTDIKVITGVRRSGKSKLMEAFINAVKNQPKDIFHRDISVFFCGIPEIFWGFRYLCFI